MAKQWFDPHNLDHCKAYRHFQKTGAWPEGFEVHDMRLGQLAWQMAIMGKMVNAWLDHILNSGKFIIKDDDWGTKK